MDSFQHWRKEWEASQYAFWLGSGISRERVDDVKGMVSRVLTYLRDRIDAANPHCQFHRALNDALGLARLSREDRASSDFTRPITQWPAINTVLSNLAWEYARLLDIRIAGCPDDHLLWDAVDVPTTFAAATAEPDCEHFCIVVLALEGVLENVVTANWDGLIEAAAEKLSEDAGAALQVCVRAEDLRQTPLMARLLKFHGCAVRAGADPTRFRPLLIARFSQITDWPTNPAFSVMRQQLVNLAVTRPTLMIGLSAQDSNIQHIFAEARNMMTWGWPCIPPAHVFAEDVLGTDQINILRVVYRDKYEAHGPEIEAGSLFRAFAKPALTALVLHVLFTKLSMFAQLVEGPSLSYDDRSSIKQGIVFIRNKIAESADPDRLAFILALIFTSSRGWELFQRGQGMAAGATTYRPIGRSPIQLIATDPELATSGVREMAAAMGILGLGESDASWRLLTTDLTEPANGIVRVANATGESRIFFVANNHASIQLEINSVISPDDKDVIVIHSTAPVPKMARSPRTAPGRTGHPGVRNVGMRELLREASGIDDLRHRFREEVAL